MNSQTSASVPPTSEHITPEALRTIFAHTQGMLLSQVCDLCHLEGTTIQNWVKRGLVPPPEHKRYDLRTVARILIVDLLRDCLSLEHIAFLLSCINGELIDISDDLLEEPELFQYLHSIIRVYDAQKPINPDAIPEIIRRYGPYFEDRKNHERVQIALQAMLYAYSAVQLKHQAKRLIDTLMQQYPKQQNETDLADAKKAT